MNGPAAEKKKVVAYAIPMLPGLHWKMLLERICLPSRYAALDAMVFVHQLS